MCDELAPLLSNGDLVSKDLGLHEFARNRHLWMHMEQTERHFWPNQSQLSRVMGHPGYLNHPGGGFGLGRCGAAVPTTRRVQAAGAGCAVVAAAAASTR